jgi:hypothetical protein
MNMKNILKICLACFGFFIFFCFALHSNVDVATLVLWLHKAVLVTGILPQG